MRPYRRHLFRCRTFCAQIVSAPIRCSLTVQLFRVRVRARVWVRVRQKAPNFGAEKIRAEMVARKSRGPPTGVGDSSLRNEFSPSSNHSHIKCFWINFTYMVFCCRLNIIHASGSALWSSGNAFGTGKGGLRFKSRTVHVGYSVANGSPLLRHFFQRSGVARRRNDAEMGPTNSSHISALCS